jgi:hypothetical protein
MPSLTEWPREIKRGPLKGLTFDSQAEYDQARAEVGTAPEADTPPAAPNETRSARQRRGKVDKAQVYAILFPLNVGLWMVPQTRADALTDEELERLCEAVVKVAVVNKHVERAILQGAQSSAYVELAIVVGAIAVRRAARHGYLPAYLDQQVGGVMGLGDAPAPTVAEPTTNGAAPFAGETVGAPS